MQSFSLTISVKPIHDDELFWGLTYFTFSINFSFQVLFLRPGFMRGNEIMLFFFYMFKNVSVIFELTGISIYAGIEHPKRSLLYLENGKKRDIKSLALLSAIEQYFYSLNAKLCTRMYLIISW